MKFTRFLPILFILLDACIDRLAVDENVFAPRLVVDGAITDRPGPYAINLYYSFHPADRQLKKAGVSGASIILYDDQGNQESFVEKVNGRYETQAGGMQGTIGRKYHISISIEGKEYKTDPQELMPAGSIEELYAEYKENDINAHNPLLPQDAVYIYFDAKGVTGSSNLFRWRWSETYELMTYPAERTKWVNGEEYPDPLPCSGYVAEGKNLFWVSECTCCSCWRSGSGTNAIVSDNEFVSDDTFDKVQLIKLPAEHTRFGYRYYVKVEQLSLSPEVYEFWKLVEAQQEGASDLFQPNTIKIKGNVKSISDPEEIVLGVFAVSAITQRDLFIGGTFTPKRMVNPRYTDDCRLAYPGSTNAKPSFW